MALLASTRLKSQLLAVSSSSQTPIALTITSDMATLVSGSWKLLCSSQGTVSWIRGSLLVPRALSTPPTPQEINCQKRQTQTPLCHTHTQNTLPHVRLTPPPGEEANWRRTLRQSQSKNRRIPSRLLQFLPHQILQISGHQWLQIPVRQWLQIPVHPSCFHLHPLLQRLHMCP